MKLRYLGMAALAVWVMGSMACFAKDVPQSGDDTTYALPPADTAAIQNLIGKYSLYWDSGDLRFAGLFTDDAVVDMSVKVLHGRSGAKAFHDERMASFKANGIQTRHLMTSLVIDGRSATEADVNVYAEVFRTSRNTDASSLMPPVHYQGVAVKDAKGHWRFSQWSARPDHPFPADTPATVTK